LPKSSFPFKGKVAACCRKNSESLSKIILYLLQNRRQKIKHHFIFKPNYFKSQIFQFFLTFLVVFLCGFIEMYLSIEFYNKFFRRAIKINNIVGYAVLSTKFSTLELRAFKVAPQKSFSGSSLVPKFLSKFLKVFMVVNLPSHILKINKIPNFKTLRNSNLEFIWELVLSNPSAYSLLPQVYPFANAASLGTAPRFRFYGDCFRQFLQMQFRKRDAALHCEPDRTAPACYFLSRNRVL